MKRKFYNDEALIPHAISILDIAEDAVICVNKEWNIILFNRGAEKLFGYKSQEILGKPINILIPHQYKQGHTALMQGFAKSKITSKQLDNRSPVLALHKNNELFAAQVTISKIKTEQGAIFTAILRDMTQIQSEQNRLEEANKNLEAKVKERTAHLQEANSQLKKEIAQRRKTQQLLEKEFQARLNAESERTKSIQIVEQSSKLASIGVIAAGITHEINQPLNAIKITAAGILYWEKRNKNILPQRFIDKIKDILQATDRIDEIVRHMRSFWDSQKKPEEKVNTCEVIKKALSLATIQLQSRGISLQYKFPRRDLYIKGNPIQLEQIIINLIANAMHAVHATSKPDKYIELKVSKRKSNIEIKIIDNGTGFEGVSKRDLFDPFYSTKNNSGMGMGLGLAIVKHFVERLEGKIRFFNNKLGGATFCLEIPLYDC